jgi:rSAM/selenodomain-associated transferase 2
VISVIIPAWNEAELLPATLAHLRANETPHEILVVDGGSTDGTVGAVRTSAPETRILVSPRRQRAGQMNAGAQEARGDTLLFLHADTWLGPNALRQIERALLDERVVGGGFARRFRGAAPFLAFTSWLAEQRGRGLGWFLGDQAIFVRRQAFEQLGGYRDIPLFEDLDFSRRLARRNRVVVLRPPVMSSARRFVARGSLRTTLSDVWLTCRYLSGADPHRLAEEGRQRHG